MMDKTNQASSKKGIALYGYDCLTSRLLIPRLLEYLGYTCIIAYTGEELMEKANRLLPDIIVLDELGNEDNLALCQRLKMNEPTKNVPVLLLLNPSKNILRDRAIEMGAVDCLSKPIEINEFQASLETHHSD